MSNRWTDTLSLSFWNNRTINTVIRDDQSERRILQMHATQADRAEREERAEERFVEDHASQLANNTSPPVVGLQTAENLQFWIAHMSWSYCKDCNLLQSEKLLPGYAARRSRKTTTAFSCKTGRYIIPQFSQIPNVLQNLSMDEVRALRPFTIHTGAYERLQHGYQKKTDILRIKWSQTDVDSQIENLPDTSSRQRCRNAYQYLMSSEQSSYSAFVEQRQRAVEDGSFFNLYNNQQSAGVECALWPQLYPFRDWCETITDGRQSRLSTKVAFLCKVLSSIIDYGLQYELLQFHYDLWLFRTVSGAIGTARRLHCSPARSLENKTFSTGYWRWEHRCLVDAVLQFGFPHVFVTISPYEWTFPVPAWLQKIRTLTGRGPTQLAAFETIHITHILEQVVRGYLCGSNSNKWTAHVFSNKHKPRSPNVETYFYRFEFQQRGTAHVHLLVWLKELSQTQYNLIRADIPWSNRTMASLAAKLQKSDKSCLPVNDTPTEVITVQSQRTLQIHHPRDAFDKHIRAYISSLLPALKCTMDVQTTDGKGMLLRYVTSYVTKWQDAYSNDSLYSRNVGPFQAAYRHLKEMRPLEPEMWLSLSSTKIAWTPSRRKRFTVPTSETAAQNLTNQKYKRRARSAEHLSFLTWLRQVDESKNPPKDYATGTTLVGIKMRSPFNDEYFFQHLVLNVPHRSQNTFFDRHFQQLPTQIKFFASAFAQNNQLWKHDNLVFEHFSREGHRDYFVETVVAHVASLRDLHSLWQREVLTTNMFQVNSGPTTNSSPDPTQSAVLRTFQQMADQRDTFYRTVNCVEEPTSDDDLDMDNPPEHAQQQTQTFVYRSTVDWKKYLLVTGKPGTGKSHLLKLIIDDCIEQNRRVLVSVPTGFLSTQYKDEYGDSIWADTIHSSFHYPVLPNERPSLNWDIANYDVVLIDELSMISTKIFQHVNQTINEVTVRPIVILCGDDYQQQPIETVDNHIVQTKSIMQEQQFRRIVHEFKLTIQHRTRDDHYRDFLNFIRYWKPTTRQLNDIQANRILCPNDKPTDNQIVLALREHPTATVLTVSRSASNRINLLFIKELFSDDDPIGEIRSDCALGTIPLYRGLRVMITQNRDKQNRVVNGQQAVVHMLHNKTVFLKLPTNNIVPIYPVTSPNAQGEVRTVYPLMPSYSLSICKAQGQTLSSCIIWFDVLTVPPGSAYVALSRVRRLNDLYLLIPMLPAHFTPVSTE